MSESLTVTFEPDVFTNVFYRYEQAQTRFICVWGGASSSKSYSVHQSELIKLLDEPQYDTLFLRKYASDIYDSCYKLLKDIAQTWGIDHVFKWNFSNQKREIVAPNGKRILFRGMDDSAKIKSIAGIKDIILEEAEQFLFGDFLELNRRARGIPGIRIVPIFNPILESHWLNMKLMQSEQFAKNLTSIHCTYKDNLEFLTADDIENLEMLKEIDPEAYRVYSQGTWGRMNVMRPWAFNFEDRHIKTTPYNPDYPIILSWDFNIDPFVVLMCQVFRDSDGHHIHVFDEIAIENGSVPVMLGMLESRMDEVEISRVEITGDASQHKRDINQADNRSSYQMIFEGLKVARNRRRVPKSNPKLESSRELVNFVLYKHPGVSVDPKCTTLIQELRYTEADEAGGIPKKNRNKLEQRADALDCYRYLLNAYVRDYPLNWRKY